MAKGKGTPKSRPSKIEACVAEIVHDIAHGEWDSARSPHEKAKAWGVSVDVVSRYASEAYRTLKYITRPDKDDLRAVFIARCQAIGREARMLPNGISSAVRALELEAKLQGLIERPNAITRTPAPFHTLPPGEQLERLREIRAYCDEQENRLIHALPMVNGKVDDE